MTLCRRGRSVLRRTLVRGLVVTSVIGGQDLPISAHGSTIALCHDRTFGMQGEGRVRASSRRIFAGDVLADVIEPSAPQRRIKFGKDTLRRFCSRSPCTARVHTTAETFGGGNPLWMRTIGHRRMSTPA